VNLLVIRHGIAIEGEDWQGDDELRPLTDDGVRKMQKGADGLHAIVDVIDVVAASPLVRA
jgi:phosphohistidine phosphatase